MVVGEGGASLAGLENLINKVLAGRESEKEQAKKIDAIEKDLKLVKGLICDENGNCRLPTKQDLVRLAEAQGAKGDLTQYKGQELWDQIKKNERYEKDIEKIHLKKLKENRTYLREALNDPEIVERIADVICNDEGCKIIWNTSVDKVKSGKVKQEKEHFLIKKK